MKAGELEHFPLPFFSNMVSYLNAVFVRVLYTHIRVQSIIHNPLDTPASFTSCSLNCHSSSLPYSYVWSHKTYLNMTL